jgi:hypothetical protein
VLPSFCPVFNLYAKHISKSDYWVVDTAGMARPDSLIVGSNEHVGVGFLPTSRFTCDSEWGSLSKARQ